MKGNFMSRFSAIGALLVILISTIFIYDCKDQSHDPASNSPDLQISIGTDPDFPGQSEVIMENAIYKAVFRVNKEQSGELEHAIRDWIIKSIDQDQVEAFIDACAQRPVCKGARVTFDGKDKKTIRLLFGEDEFITDYSIFANSPVIQIDYIKYDNKENGWCNTVDIGTPGGITERNKATTRLFGQESFIRPLQYHEDSYWNVFDGGEYADDPADAGSLNYKGHMIMAVGNPGNGAGFARVMPIYSKGVQGGPMIIKLLWDVGFETFPAVGKQQAFRPSFTGYIFVFDDGMDKAIEMGKQIVEGDMLVSK